jgi:hypothetical protein
MVTKEELIQNYLSLTIIFMLVILSIYIQQFIPPYFSPLEKFLIAVIPFILLGFIIISLIFK